MAREHGTHARYVLGPTADDQPGKGCRCDECRAANAAYERARAQRVEPPYVGADRARQHILYLRDQGIGLKTVAKRSGVAHGSLSKLIYGDAKRGMGPSKRIRPETERAILSVVATIDQGDGTRIPADQTWRDIETLLERGWSKAAIAAAIGQGGSALQIGRQLVTRRNALAIRKLLDQPVQVRKSRWGTPRAKDAARLEAFEEATEQPRPEADLPRLLELAIQPWRRNAACRLPNVPARLFFPGRGDTQTTDRAKKVCSYCPVAADCLRWALDHDETGIWGGTSDNERRRMRSVAS